MLLRCDHTRRYILVTLGALTIATAPTIASAHVRWFVESERYPLDWSRLVSLPTLIVIVAGLLLYGSGLPPAAAQQNLERALAREARPRRDA